MARNHITPRKIVVTGTALPTTEEMMNTLNPSGGVISPISRYLIMMTPNQISETS